MKRIQLKHEEFMDGIKTGFFIGALVMALAFFLLAPKDACAVEVEFGVQSFEDPEQVLQLAISEDFEIKDNLFWRARVGYWNDDRAVGESSVFGGPSFGVKLEPFNYFDVRVEVGMIAVAKTDIFLGSWWNFTECGSMGFKDGQARAGVRVCHASSGRSDVPNRGRNMALVFAAFEI